MNTEAPVAHSDTVITPMIRVMNVTLLLSNSRASYGKRITLPYRRTHPLKADKRRQC
jgi:hypothetical protein